MSYLTFYEEAFSKCVTHISNIVKESIDKTEKDLGKSMSLEEKKFCIGLAIVYLLGKLGER